MHAEQIFNLAGLVFSLIVVNFIFASVGVSWSDLPGLVSGNCEQMLDQLSKAYANNAGKPIRF